MKNSETTKPKRGGAGRNQGRKPLSETEKTVTVCVRMPESYRDKLDRMAGEHDRSWWVRAVIKKSKEK